MFKPKVILHPTDFHPASTEAFHVSADLAKAFDATLYVLHVLDMPSVVYSEFVPLIELDRESIKDEARRKLLNLKRPDDGPIEYLLIDDGTTETAIVREAENRHCDLIVMGTAGRSGVSRFLLGSVAEYVLRKVHCPVFASESSRDRAGRPAHEHIVNPIVTSHDLKKEHAMKQSKQSPSGKVIGNGFNDQVSDREQHRAVHRERSFTLNLKLSIQAQSRPTRFASELIICG